MTAGNETNFYALFDLQLNGFKAGYASTDKESVERDGAERAFYLSESDEEPCDEKLSDIEILEQYDYEVKEVSEETYKKVLNSDDYGLLTAVKL